MLPQLSNNSCIRSSPIRNCDLLIFNFCKTLIFFIYLFYLLFVMHNYSLFVSEYVRKINVSMLNLALKGQNLAWLVTEALYVVGRLLQH